MSFMKKFVAMLCVLCLLCCLAACGEKDTEAPASKSPAATATTAPKPTEKASEVPSEKPTAEATAATTPGPSTEAPTATAGPVDITKLTNVALQKPVTEQGHAYESVLWNKNFLTDEFKMLEDEDGKTTGWMSDDSENIDDETWVYVDLEDTYKVQAVAIYPRGLECYFPVAYEIQLSTDAETWTTVHTETEDYGYLDTDRVFEITPTEASYVRILIKERSDSFVSSGSINGYVVEISEIEVYA